MDKNSFLLFLLALLLLGGGSAVGEPFSYDPSKEVDVELVLAVDISQSMDTDEQEIQRAGYVAALTSTEFLNAIKIGPIGRIAVSYMEWGGKDEQFIVADWTVIQDAKSAEAFAAQIAEAQMRSSSSTSIFFALKKAGEILVSNEYFGLRQVIDISGDGPNNNSTDVEDMRDELLRAGVIINGLPLMMSPNQNTSMPEISMDNYYEDCVIGGTGSFMIPVRSKAEFEFSIRMKLIMEIAKLTFEQKLIHRVSGRTKVSCSY